MAEIIHPKFWDEPQRIVAEDGRTLAEYAEMVDGLPGAFWQSGSIIVDGYDVPRELWMRARPRGDRQVLICLPPLDGGDGGKNPVAVLAAVAVLALTAGIASGGIAIAFGLGASSTFAAGGLGANLLAAGVGLGSQLLLQGLFKPPQALGFAEDAVQQGSAGLGGELVRPGGGVPRVCGLMRVRPLLASRPISVIDGEDEVVEAVYVLGGPHKLIKALNGDTDLTDLDGLQTEVREGFDGDMPLSFFNRYGKPERLGITLSKHKLQDTGASVDLENQSAPESSLPKFHRATTAKDPDEIWLRLNLIGIADSNNSNDQYLSFRMRIRRVGDTDWKRLPEIVYKGRSDQPVRKDVRIILDRPVSPLAVSSSDVTNTFSDVFDTVPAVTVDHVMSKTTDPSQWQSDLVFGSDKISDGLLLHQNDPWFDGGGTFEIEIKRSQMFDTSKANIDDPNDYNWTAPNGVYDLFDAFLAGNDWRVREDPKGTAEQVVWDTITSIWNSAPVKGDGWFVFGVRARNIRLDSITLEVEGYVPNWDGSGWRAWSTTANPAAHFRFFQSGLIASDPIPAKLLDEQSILDWWQNCEARGYECNAIVQPDESVGDALDMIAACGYALRRQSQVYGVVHERDRTSESYKQVLTPLNSAGFGTSRPFAKKPSALRVSFLDRDKLWKTEEILVPNPLGKSADDGLPEKISYRGLTTAAQARARAEYDQAAACQREALHTMRLGVESLISKKGDLVGVSQPILQRHFGYARIAKVISDTEFIVDAPIEYINREGLFAQSEVFSQNDIYVIGQRSAVAVRTPTDDVQIVDVINYVPESRTVTVGAPVVSRVGDLVTFGLSGQELKRMIVQNIVPEANLTATVSLVDEAPDLISYIP